jgi:hypothetical protein
MDVGLLSPQERSSLEAEVAKLVFASHVDLLDILGMHATEIAMVQPAKRYAKMIVRYCELSAWVENPALIIRLINNWSVEVKFKTIVDRLQQLPPPIWYKSGRPWETCLVASELPFIDRTLTRQAVESFLQPLNDPFAMPLVSRVLVVNGPEGCGKTYTNKYLQYLNSVFTNLNFKVAYIDYKIFVTSRFGPKELVESILAVINPTWKATTTLPKLGEEQQSRDSMLLVQFLAKQIAKTGERWFLVLDRFNDTTVPRETIELIQHLAKVATGAEYAEDSRDLIRLVLLGFNDVIENYEDRVVIDAIQPLTASDIAEYFRLFIEVNDCNIDINDAQMIKILVDEVMQHDPGPDSPMRTKILSEEAIQVALDLPKKN